MRELNSFELDMVNGGSDRQTGTVGERASEQASEEQDANSIQGSVGSTVVLFGESSNS